MVGGAKRGDEAGFGATGEPTERERDPLCQGPVLVQGLVKGTGYVRAKEEPRLVGWIISFKQQHATARFVQVLLMFYCYVLIMFFINPSVLLQSRGP